MTEKELIFMVIVDRKAQYALIVVIFLVAYLVMQGEYT